MNAPPPKFAGAGERGREGEPDRAPIIVPSAKFAPGERVRVRMRCPPGHVRTPWYCRGRVGEIERVCGRFRNPEQLAYGNRDAAHEVLYRVSFASRSLWPGCDGGERDRVEIEIYEHWLEPAPGDAR